MLNIWVGNLEIPKIFIIRTETDTRHPLTIQYNRYYRGRTYVTTCVLFSSIFKNVEHFLMIVLKKSEISENLFPTLCIPYIKQKHSLEYRQGEYSDV